MNKWLYISVAVMLLAGCEVIPESARLIPVQMQVEERAHLLVEFTGFRCVNCPKAAERAEELHALYGDQLVVVAMHPASNPFTQGKYDYTCPAADDYYRLYGGTASTPFPTGNVDGIATSGGYLYDYQEWPTVLAEAMRWTTDVHLSAHAESKDGEAHVSVTCYADNEQDAGLRIWLVEDSICGAQAMPDGSVNTAYYHRHVLRDAWGDPQGEAVHLRTLAAVHEAAMPLQERYDLRHCYVVAMLVDRKDGHILNVIQTRLL